MASHTLGGILLGTPDADRLREWYIKALNPRVEGPVLFFGDVVLVCDQRDDVGEKNPEPGRQILCFGVEDAMATAEHLNELGVTWLTEVADREQAWIGTLIDPDGNYVQIVQHKH
ncbi:VOC family protein [Streptosporangium sp. NPDC051023]|uniref:VOC family protein n=1 Tax=Streptosporangium sp. NPDC051023 TaxID=3155410 RepID=UPI00344BDBD7